MGSSNEDYRAQWLVSRLVKPEPRPPVLPAPAVAVTPETLERWARHARLEAREQEEKRLRAIVQDPKMSYRIYRMDKLGKKVGKRDQAIKRHGDVSGEIIRRSNRHKDRD